MKSWQSLPREIVKFSHLYRSTRLKMLKLSGKLIPKEFPLSISLPMAPCGGRPDTGLLTAKSETRPATQICQMCWRRHNDTEFCGTSHFLVITFWSVSWPKDLLPSQAGREGSFTGTLKNRGKNRSKVFVEKGFLSTSWILKIPKLIGGRVRKCKITQR